MAPNAHRSRSISDISTSVLSVYTTRVRALCVEEPQLGRTGSAITISLIVSIVRACPRCLRSRLYYFPYTSFILIFVLQSSLWFCHHVHNYNFILYCSNTLMKQPVNPACCVLILLMIFHFGSPDDDVTVWLSSSLYS